MAEKSYYTKQKQKYDRLTPAEQAFVRSHPYHAWTFEKAATKALLEAQKRFPNNCELHNGKGDAFRHAYWSALMTKAAGTKEAGEFGDAHETNAGNPKAEKDMDLFNNAVGRKIAEDNPGVTEDELATYVMNALNDGRLQWIATCP